jgi:thioesterase domain-containing protein/non-ribosomal peptide synthetase component F/acyl carrier protein
MTASFHTHISETTSNIACSLANEVYVMPSSLAQQRFWLLDQLEPGNTSLNMPLALRICGELDVDALELTISEIIARHEILRTTFAVEKDKLVQVIVAAQLTNSFEVVTASGSAEQEIEEWATRLTLDEAHTTFDLQRGPLFKAKLLRLCATDHILLLTMHHIVCDGWSNGVLVREIGEIYEALSKGLPSPLPELPIQYGDFALWQQEWLESESFQEQLEYWRGHLGENLPPLDLPTDFPRNRNRASFGAIESLLLSRPLTKALKVLAQREEVTEFMVFLAAFNVLLHRYTGGEQLMVGSPTANRIHSESEPLIGTFANTLMLKTDLSGNPSFGELLQRVKEVALGAFDNQTLPFEMLVEALRPAQTRAGNQLIQVLFIFQTAFMQPVKLEGLTITPMRSVSPGSIFELSLGVVERAEGARLQMEYNTDLFESESIKLMLGHLQSILRSVATDARQTISEIPILTRPERQLLLVDRNRTDEVTYPDKTIGELSDEWANLTPERIAAACAGQRISYGELKRRSDSTAIQLHNLGLSKGDRVGIRFGSLPGFAVGLLGVLKAGFVAVPLNRNSRVEEFCSVIIGSGEATELQNPKITRRRNAEETETSEVRDEQSGPPALIGLGENGVAILISQGAMVARGKALVEQMEVTADDTVLIADNWGCCSTLEAVVGALLAGAGLVSVPIGSTARDALRAMNDEHVTSLCLPPCLFYRIASDSFALPEKARVFAVSGARVSRAAIGRFGNPKAKLLIGYGSAMTGYAAALIDASGDRSSLKISRQSPNTRMYVLDRNLQPVPAGVAGTLHVVAEATSAAPITEFEMVGVRSVFVPAIGEKAFCTDDAARYLRSGEIELLDDSDVIGGAIDVAIVEDWLLEHPAVIEAKVVFKEDHFVCYVALKESEKIDESAFRDLVKEKRPGVTLAVKFVMVSSLPLTPEGTVDTIALPDAGVALAANDDEVAAVDYVEAKLKEIWKDVLGVSSVETRDDFFELGGHSLTAVKLFDQIKKELGANLPLAVMFKATTIEKLATIIREETPKDKWSSVVPITVSGFRSPFFAVDADGGNLFFHKDLAMRLGPNHSFFGLQARGLDGMQHAHLSIEEMAAHYIEEIKRLRPSGPYHLGGVSFGGLVAYEMSRLLRERGEEVALLALLDTYAPGYPKLLPGTSKLSVKFWGVLQRIQNDIVTIRILESDARWPFIVAKTKKARNQLCRSIRNGRKIILRRVLKSLGRPVPAALKETQNAILVASRTYRPRPYSGVITLFRATQQPRGIHKDATLGWGDLAAGGLQIHERLPLASLFQAPTIEQLARILGQNEPSTNWHSLVPINPIGMKPPLYCVHAGGGNVLFYRNLASHLGSDQPVYALQARGLDGKQPFHTRVEEMASDYLKEIRSVQPNGPYFLAGRCFGGIVVYEMAQQLRAQGQKVALLAILDSGHPRTPGGSSMQKPRKSPGDYLNRLSGRIRGRRLHILLSEQISYLPRRLRLFYGAIRNYLSYLMCSPEAKRLQRLEKNNKRALMNYLAETYPGRVTLIRSHEFHSSQDKDWHLRWAEVAGGGLECHVVDGTHISMFEEPYVGTLADRLRDCIAAASAEP